MSSTTENITEKSKDTSATDVTKSPSRSSKRLSMSSEGNSNIPENGTPSDDTKQRKSLRSSVITDNDPLKIKLKISKSDIIEPVKHKKDCDERSARSYRKSELKNGDDKLQDEESAEESSEKKRKLRSRKENEEGSDSKEETDSAPEEKRKKSFKLMEEAQVDVSDGEVKVAKKRGRHPKIQNNEDAVRDEGAKRRSKRIETGEAAEDVKAAENESNETRDDPAGESFCWTCHKDGSVVKCDTCPRVFHLKCVSLTKDPSKNWICPECSLVLHAETISTRSEAMKSLSLDQLCTLLGFAIERMKNVPESEAFWKPVDPMEVPMYDKYVTNPMDLKLLEKNMKAKMYGSPQAFLADAKWLLHNSIIFNSTQSPLTSTARFLVKICRQEMAEIENCPDCYLNAHTKEDWFVEVCRKPHILIWARLKGFPFWPAKAMCTNLKTQQVDARFFGAHDKAWVPVKECYLYSKNSPQLINKKRGDLDNAFLEVEGYIRKIKQKFGTFSLAPDRTPFVPEMYDKQLQILIPNYKGDDSTPKKKKKLVEQKIEENGVVEKTVQNGKKVTEHGAQHRFKLKRPVSIRTATPTPPADDSKILGDINSINDYVTEEKVLSDDKISPEDEVARSLEMFDTHKRLEGEAVDENSLDVEDEASVPIPEHAYSRVVEEVASSSSVSSVSNEVENLEAVKNVVEKGESCENHAEPEKTDEIVTESNESNKDVTVEENKVEEEQAEEEKNSVEEEEKAEKEGKVDKEEREVEKNESKTSEKVEEKVEEKKIDEEKVEEKKIDEVRKEKVEEKKINEVRKEKEVKKKVKKPSEKVTKPEKPSEKSKELVNEEPEQCEVSSTNAEMNDVSTSSEVVNEESTSNSNLPDEIDAVKSKNKRKSTDSNQEIPEKKSNSGKNEESSKAEEDKSSKSFTNLSEDQKQKIITEAKLLANIDEMTALGKQKVLNELGLDASQVDIRQLAQENREILETLTKKGHSEEVAQKPTEEVPIKNEDFEQYLMEESNEENDFDDSIPEAPPSAPRLGSIKVRDINTLSKGKTAQNKNCEPMLKIMDLQSLKDLKSSKDKLKRKKSSDDPTNSGKKLKGEPMVELIKIDSYDKNVQKLNRKLRLSDEVSLLMVDGEKKTNVELDIDSDSNSNSNSNSSFKKLPLRQYEKSSKVRSKVTPNRTKESSNSTSEKSPPKRPLNVISVDTEISNAQKTLLKSLCLEEKKQVPKTDEKDKNIRIINVKGNCEITKKQYKDITIETVKDNSKTSGKDSAQPQKNVTVVANSHLILTNNGPTFVNQNNQPNLALAQNNLGQLSLVHLTNLTSGIQTNFVNLANETIGFNNSIGTLYATPAGGFSADGFPTVPSTGSSSVILTTSSTSSSPNSTTTNAQSSGSGSSSAGKLGKAVNESSKVPIPRLGSAKSTTGISVKSPASLGLVAGQSSSSRLGLPPLVAKPGEEGVAGEIGSVTAELNRHSLKLAEYMRATIEDILRELSNQGSLEAKYKTLLIEMEKLQWRHQQEILELKHHSERNIMELRNTLEAEKQKSLTELRSQLEAQHQKEISETKHKQWCANCGKEALFYCCWNTSYCDYPCQQQHWPGHMSTCAQLGNNIQANNQIPGKGMKYQNATYVPIISRGGSGTHSGGPFAANRAIPSVQILEQPPVTNNKSEESKEVAGEIAYSTSTSHLRRPADSPTPQLPINITIRPQHYFM